VIIGLLIIVSGLIVSVKIAGIPKEVKTVEDYSGFSEIKVLTDKVEWQKVETYVETSGLVKAKNKVEIYSDVIGTVLPNAKRFTKGERFNKGDILLSIDKKEKELSLFAAKEDFYSLILSLLSDIKTDYPESYDNWKSYTEDFDITKRLKKIPDAKSEKEKYFLSSKKVLYKYLTIESTETNLEKYTIKAPFSGTIIDGEVNPGTLVRNNQKLGEFIEDGVFEIQLDIPVDLINDLKTGSKVEIFDDLTNTSGIGKIARINNSVNTQSQTITIFAVVENNTFLKDGMYFKTRTYLQSFTNAYLLDKKFLTADNQVITISDNRLKFVSPNILGFQDNKVILGDISEGTVVVNQLLPNAVHGMNVSPIEK
jgi:multidrug efflux pump subunit AcrA (membrane-fusion protein)